MKLLISSAVLSLAMFGASAAVQAKDAGEPSPARTAQREKMKACNAEAKAAAKKGDERKAFMKQCLSAKKKE